MTRHNSQVTARILRKKLGKPCPYCSRRMKHPSRDHINPKSRGFDLGQNGWNRIIVCEPCNKDKKNMDLSTYLNYLLSTPNKDALTLVRIENVTHLVKTISVRYSSTTYPL